MLPLLGRKYDKKPGIMHASRARKLEKNQFYALNALNQVRL